MARTLVRGVLGLPQFMKDQFSGHCEVAQRLAERLGLSVGLIHALGQVYERWDGKGYPNGLRGLEIPLSARIVMLADTFDAVSHNRRYRTGRGNASAAEVIAAGRGTQFDPDLVDLMLLPPVFDRIVAEERAFRRAPRTVKEDRRRGQREADTPDVTFRWRPEPRVSRSPDPVSQRAR